MAGLGSNSTSGFLIDVLHPGTGGAVASLPAMGRLEQKRGTGRQVQRRAPHGALSHSLTCHTKPDS
jgi:hypothetical protein